MTDTLSPHSHDPNPEPPSYDTSLQLLLPDGHVHHLSVADLGAFPQIEIVNCYIISTGHGTSGPFVFGGVALQTIMEALAQSWSQAEVISGDGFGTRVYAPELAEGSERPILLALTKDGVALTRQDGLVRLIVPSETDDALRQVKWIERINLLA